MPVHLVKLCVGADSIADLAQWQKSRLAAMKKAGEKPELCHRTFQTPKRRAEILDGGSLYWVIKGVVQVAGSMAEVAANETVRAAYLTERIVKDLEAGAQD